MSLLSALCDQENSGNQGWSQASMFDESTPSSQDENNINVWPECDTPRDSSFTEESQMTNYVFEDPFDIGQETSVESQPFDENTSVLHQDQCDGTNDTIVSPVCVQQDPGTSQQIMQLNVGSSPSGTATVHQTYYNPIQKSVVILPKMSQTPGQVKKVFRYQTLPQEKGRSVIYSLLNAKQKNNTSIVNNAEINAESSLAMCNAQQQQTILQTPQKIYTQSAALNVSSPCTTLVTSVSSSSDCSEELTPSQIVDHGYAINAGSPNKESQSGNSSISSPQSSTVLVSNLNPHISRAIESKPMIKNRLLGIGDNRTVFQSYRQETSNKAKQPNGCQTMTYSVRPQTNKALTSEIQRNCNASLQVHNSQQSNRLCVPQVVNIILGQSSSGSCTNSSQTTPLSTNSSAVVLTGSPISIVDQTSQSTHSDISSALTCTVGDANSNASSSISQQNHQHLTPVMSSDSVTSSGSLTPVTKGSISELKVDNFIKNKIYLYKSSNGTVMNMQWDGKQFIEVPEKSCQNHAAMIGGGLGSHGRDKNLKGNATGLNMVSNSQGITSVRQNVTADTVKVVTSTVEGSNLLPNGRLWLHADSPQSRTLTRRPLHENQSPSSSSNQNSSDDSVDLVESSSNSSQSASQKSDMETPGQSSSRQLVKRTIQEAGEDLNVLCRFCGYINSNMDSCERCYRTFPADTKPMKKVKKNDGAESVTDTTSVISNCTTSTSTNNAISKQRFYGNKLEEQSMPYKKTNILSVKSVSQSRGRIINNQGATYKLVRVTANKKNHSEPETVTISSDEDEDSEESHTQKLKEPENSQINHIASDSQPSQQTSEENDELSKLVSILPQKSSSPKFKGSRLKKMEDKEGVAIYTKRGRGRPRKICTETESLPLDVTSNNDLEMNAKYVRVGSLKGVPIEPVFFTDTGISLYIECEDNAYRINIHPEDVIKCYLHFSHTAMLFIRTSDEFGNRMRGQLEMSSDPPAADSGAPYFNPNSKDIKHQYVTIIPQSMTCKMNECLTSILNKYPEKRGVSSEQFVQSLHLQEAENLLAVTSPPAIKSLTPTAGSSGQKNLLITAQNNKSIVYKVISGTTMKDGKFTLTLEHADSPPSPPPSTFSGPVEKLVSYPPPPSTGGIMVTTADLFCLNEGEFLNDVIIDFYLRYLCLEMLKEEDRKRTHVFSSFFFKCLTQRQSRSCSKDGSEVLTPAEKRHARVKKWTKHVDLFEKDFIIVPINEHSHWFLAIICFPGLKEIQPIHYLPRRHVTESSTTDSQTSNDSEMQDESEGRHETPMDTSDSTPSTPNSKLSTRELRGQIIEDKDSLSAEQRKFLQRGQRQPCIMIFDSLAGQSKSRIVTVLKDYLQVEWKAKKNTPCNLKERLRGCTPKVPQQTNFSDCGVYVLQYAQSFFEDPLIDYSFPIKCLQNWFDESVVSRKRKEIHDLVMNLKEKYEQGNS